MADIKLVSPVREAPEGAASLSMNEVRDFLKACRTGNSATIVELLKVTQIRLYVCMYIVYFHMCVFLNIFICVPCVCVIP
jgi:hypothetical protein